MIIIDNMYQPSLDRMPTKRTKEHSETVHLGSSLELEAQTHDQAGASCQNRFKFEGSILGRLFQTAEAKLRMFNQVISISALIPMVCSSCSVWMCLILWQLPPSCDGSTLAGSN